jgi:hypothetical protein
MGAFHRRSIKRGVAFMGGLVMIAGLSELATYPLWRNRCLNWGATRDEAPTTLPGDDLMSEPDIVSTRAIGIDAEPSAVWPWLAQMGSGRGGLYTYDWIENLLGLNMHSADTVLSQFQDIKVGDTQSVGRNGPVLRVTVCEPGKALIFQSEDGHWVWAFVLQSDKNGTRLISRNRITLAGFSTTARWLYRYVMEPGSLIMERKMLLGIKGRAERLARARQTPEGRAPESQTPYGSVVAGGFEH